MAIVEMLRRAIFLIVVVAAGLTLGACEEDVAAPSGVEEPFSMYGIINPGRYTQTMLVSPIHRLLSDFSGPIDATVRSTDLETGETVTWNDSVLTGESGESFYVFAADFRAEYGSAYRIEALRSDGAVSWAEARVPERISVSTHDITTALGDTLGSMEVRVLGADFHLLELNVIYTVRWQPAPGKGDVCRLPIDSYPVSYVDQVSEIEGGYAFVVDLTSDVYTVGGAYTDDYADPGIMRCEMRIPDNPPDPKNAFPLCFQPGREAPALMDMEVHMLVAQPEWDPPGGSFDENALSDPRVLTNVTNGLGFVAGGYNDQQRVVPSEAVVGITYFFDYVQRSAATDCRDYCMCDSVARQTLR